MCYSELIVKSFQYIGNMFDEEFLVLAYVSVLELKVRSFILVLWIWRKLLIRVPREMIRWAMHKLGVEEWLVSAVMSMYTGAKTVIRTVYDNSKGFEVKVGMHQAWFGIKPTFICDCHGGDI